MPLQAPAGIRRRLPIHPGRFLERHYLEPLAMTQTEAARRLGVSRRRINELVQGRRAMSADTAIRCALAFGLPATDWLAMQADWDSYLAWKVMARAGVTSGTSAGTGSGTSTSHSPQAR
jgi:addiction module HigA family antidote